MILILTLLSSRFRMAMFLVLVPPLIVFTFLSLFSLQGCLVINNTAPVLKNINP